MKIIAVGLNYRDHAREVDMELPERPLLFAKWSNAVIGDGEPIVIPQGVEQVDYEAELAAVIGARTKGVMVLFIRRRAPEHCRLRRDRAGHRASRSVTGRRGRPWRLPSPVRESAAREPIPS